MDSNFRFRENGSSIETIPQLRAHTPDVPVSPKHETFRVDRSLFKAIVGDRFLSNLATALPRNAAAKRGRYTPRSGSHASSLNRTR